MHSNKEGVFSYKPILHYIRHMGRVKIRDFQPISLVGSVCKILEEGGSYGVWERVVGGGGGMDF